MQHGSYVRTMKVYKHSEVSLPFPVPFTLFPPTPIHDHLNLFLVYPSVFLFTKINKYKHILLSLLLYPKRSGMLLFCCKWVESEHKATIDSGLK